MLKIDPKLTQAMAPLMERMLIVDPSQTSAKFLTELLRQIWPGQVMTAETTVQGLKLARQADPQLIFVEYAGNGLDGLDFTRKLRRGDFACRQAPVIMITAQATAAAILGARDSGVHEFLRKPFTTNDLLKRLLAVSLKPRTWVEGVRYIGPDRRRFNSAEYKGARKRRSDPGGEGGASEALVQPLKIIAAAVIAIETDPGQALRSLNAQAAELQALAKKTSNITLAALAGGLARYLAQASPTTPLTREGVQPHADRILALLPAGEDRSAA